MAALTEGGDIRLVDPAVPPRLAASPRPLLTMLLATSFGLALGLALAVVLPTVPTR